MAGILSSIRFDISPYNIRQHSRQIVLTIRNNMANLSVCQRAILPLAGTQTRKTAAHNPASPPGAIQ